MKSTPFPRNFRYKCFVCGEGHKHRGKNRFRELCKSCATKFMLKGRFQKFRLPCFASQSCEEDYECPLSVYCAEAAFEDAQTPLEVVRVFTRYVVKTKPIDAWRKKKE